MLFLFSLLPSQFAFTFMFGSRVHGSGSVRRTLNLNLNVNTNREPRSVNTSITKPRGQ